VTAATTGGTAGATAPCRVAPMRVITCSIALMLACDRGHAHDEAPVPSPQRVPAAAGPACAIAALPLRLPAPRRLVAIGDLHGDLAATRAALRTAGAIDDRDRWIGGALVVIQTGDVLDRGDDERAILELVARLETESRAAGGALIMLLGNHELMNAAGDFRYVTPAGLHAFDAEPGAAAAGGPGIPEPMRSRLAALRPGGRRARQLAQHAVIAIVGDAVFSHAGVLGDWVTRVDEVNQAARCWLDGQVSERAAALTSDDSPVWTRAAGGAAVDCAAVRTALAALQVSRMVVGHTVQDHGITSACDGTVWRIDVGLARLYGGPIEVLELAPGAPPRVLRGTRD
jgi:hypothetical protein